MKEKVIMVGAGGHARSVMDILVQNEDYDLVGCIDCTYTVAGENIDVVGIPVIGNDDMLEEIYDSGVHHIFIALGDNVLRKKIYDKVQQIGYMLVNAISKNSFISPTVKLGNGVCVMAGAVINVNSVIGNNSIINTNCSIDHDCVIGNHCHIAPGVTMSGNVHVGDYTQVGTGACVIDKINIGSSSFIGAGSAVVSNISDGILAYGVPAKEIKKMNCGVEK